MPRVTKSQLDRRFELAEKVLDLKRQAATMDAEVKEIDKLAKADLEDSGKPLVRRGGYRLEWIEGRASVSWKSELVGRLGSDIASEIQQNAPKTQKLAITPP